MFSHKGLRLTAIAVAARRVIGGRAVPVVPAKARQPVLRDPGKPEALRRAARKPRKASVPAESAGRVMTAAERCTWLWQNGTPLCELRGEFGSLADEAVRAASPRLDWQRAA